MCIGFAQTLLASHHLESNAICIHQCKQASALGLEAELLRLGDRLLGAGLVALALALVRPCLHVDHTCVGRERRPSAEGRRAARVPVRHTEVMIVADGLDSHHTHTRHHSRAVESRICVVWGLFTDFSTASVRRRRPRCCRRMAHCKSRCWGRRPREADAHRARSSSTLSSPVCQDSSLATTCAQYPPSLRQSSTACSSVAHHPMVLVQRSSWQCQLVPSERCWVAYSVVLWQTSSAAVRA